MARKAKKQAGLQGYLQQPVVGSDVEVHEDLRRIVSTHGHEIRLTHVTKINNTGSWMRHESDQGYVLVNPANTFAIMIKGERKF